MPKMKSSELRALLAAERADALAAESASKLSQERTDAMDYYLGDVSKDLPTQDGRSRAVSSDVADTIEGLMPPLMEIFAGGDEVVRFEPNGPEDVALAEQETDYVNHCFMQKNDGFLVLYSFIKDALLSKNGICKVYAEEGEREEKETYTDQTEDTLAVLLQKPGSEIIEHTEHDGLHDVTILCKTLYKKTIAVPVPPEEFGISRRARSVKEATYCFHEVVKTADDLIKQNYSAEQVRKLPAYSDVGKNEEASRDTVDESAIAGGDEGMNIALRPILVTEHYIRMDYEGDDKAKLYKVTTAGEGASEILVRDGKDDIEEVEFAPFAAMTPVIMTHRFVGRSIADLVMDIQRIKTALLRATLDNAYLNNFPRPEVAERLSSDTTLDDLLVWRPGAPIRVKEPGAINWQQVPSIAKDVFPLIEYQDQTRELRTGVTRQGQGIDADALQNQSATAVQQIYSAAQQRIRLIARIFAETGIKDLFWLMHATLRKSGGQQETVRLKNQWITVDPGQWKNRSDLTVNVGLGTGGKAEQLAGMNLLIQMQTQAVAAGKSNLVKDKHLYNSAKEFVKILGLKSVEQFFDDPSDPQNPAPPPPIDPKLVQIQANAEVEKLQAQADIATNDRKMTLEATLAQQKHMQEMQQMRELHEMKMAEMRADLVGKLASAATKKTKVSGNGEESSVQESGPDMETLMAIIDKLNPKQPAMRMRKEADGSWIKEPVN